MRHIHIFSIFICSLVVLSTGCASLDKAHRTDDPDYKQGLRNMSESRYDDAIENFTDAIETWPDMGEAYYQRGRSRAMRVKENWDSQEHKKALEAAIRDYNNALRKNPILYGALFNRGLAYAALGRYRDAVASIRKVAESTPMDPEPNRALGLIYDEKFDNGADHALFYLKKYVQLGGTDESVSRRIDELKSQVARQQLQNALEGARQLSPKKPQGKK